MSFAFDKRRKPQAATWHPAHAEEVPNSTERATASGEKDPPSIPGLIDLSKESVPSGELPRKWERLSHEHTQAREASQAAHQKLDLSEREFDSKFRDFLLDARDRADAMVNLGKEAGAEVQGRETANHGMELLSDRAQETKAVDRLDQRLERAAERLQEYGKSLSPKDHGRGR